MHMESKQMPVHKLHWKQLKFATHIFQTSNLSDTKTRKRNCPKKKKKCPQPQWSFNQTKKNLHLLSKNQSVPHKLPPNQLKITRNASGIDGIKCKLGTHNDHARIQPRSLTLGKQANSVYRCSSICSCKNKNSGYEIQQYPLSLVGGLWRTPDSRTHQNI